ncbi:MAG: peptidase U32 family protein [Candidatus Kapabacteria bacterium]|jgi:putative protease|nr:peptidase U32 family protein [Candidatus Kapabacteria bacterium]
MDTNNIEIMAPVGSYESLAAAINAGAGSVYFGIDKLNMRSKSSVNFTFDDLKNITQICNENNVKSYITLNTVMYDEDYDLACKIIDESKISGVTAVIASDMSVIEYAREKGVEVHISTQVNVSNSGAVKYFSKFADVIVLARELNLEQVANITEFVKMNDIRGPKGEPVKIEMFVHGALCMAVSGKCYLSLHEYNKSANRGSCLQICRRGYSVTDNETGAELEIDNEYIMSPKDLKTIHFLDRILDAGVTVLKIEGRGRSPEYVKRTVECYHEAVEAYQSGTFSQDKVEDWNNRLAEVYNRGFWDGYYLGQKLGEWSPKYGSNATRFKKYIGDITNYFKKLSVAEVTLKADGLSVGDDLIVIGPTTGVWEGKATEIRKELLPVNNVEKGDIVSIPTDVVLRRSDKVYRWETNAVE